MKDVDPHALIRQPDDRRATHRSSVAVLVPPNLGKDGQGGHRSCCKAAFLLFQEVYDAGYVF
jgi:hypothetical protein